MARCPSSTAKKYSNKGYNKAADCFDEAGGNNTKNPCRQAVEAVKRLITSCYQARHAQWRSTQALGSTTSIAGSLEMEYG